MRATTDYLTVAVVHLRSMYFFLSETTFSYSSGKLHRFFNRCRQTRTQRMMDRDDVARNKARAEAGGSS